MLRYAALNLLVMLFVSMIIYSRLRRRQLAYKRLAYVVLIVIGLTIIFDNIIILAGIVMYNPDHISGLKLYRLPIEDLNYGLVAAILMPIIWDSLASGKGSNRET